MPGHKMAVVPLVGTTPAEFYEVAFVVVVVLAFLLAVIRGEN